jgi:hypothetical protein
VAEPTITHEKVERTQVPVTTEFGDDLYANLKLGERIGFDPIGARMVFYCIASDRTFTVTNGPIGTPWFTPVNIAAARVYAKVLDPQPDGLVASPNPYVEIRTTRPVTMANR